MAQLFTGTAVSFSLSVQPYQQAVAEPDGSKLYILAWDGSVAKLATSVNHGVTWSLENTPITVIAYDRGVSRGRNNNIYVWSSPTKGYVNIWQRTGAGQYTLVVNNYQFTTFANTVYDIHLLIASTGDMHLLWSEAPGGSPAFTIRHRKYSGGSWAAATAVWSADDGGSGNNWYGRSQACIGVGDVVHVGSASYGDAHDHWYYGYYDTSWHGGPIPSDTMVYSAPLKTPGCMVCDEVTGNLYWLRTYVVTIAPLHTVGVWQRPPGGSWTKLATLDDVADGGAYIRGLVWHRRRGELGVIYERSDNGAITLRWWRGGALTAHRTLNSQTPRGAAGGGVIPDTKWDVVLAYNLTGTYTAIADTYLVSVAPTVSVAAPAGTQANPTVFEDQISGVSLQGVYGSDAVPMAQRRHRIFDEQSNVVWDTGVVTASAQPGQSVSVIVPTGKLKYGAKYWWQWWVTDTAGYESAWSAAGWFLCLVVAPTLAATSEPGHARIRLDLAADAEGLAGFNVYRRPAGEGEYVRANPTLVPAAAGEGIYYDDVAASGQEYDYVGTAVADDGYESGQSEAAQASVAIAATWIDDLALAVAPTGFEVQEEFTGSIAPVLGRPYPVVFRRQAGRRLYLAGTCLGKADKDALTAILRAPGPHRYVDPLGEALRVEVAAPVRFSQVRPYDPDQLIYAWSLELMEVG